jgi:hypothetical protein
MTFNPVWSAALTSEFAWWSTDAGGPAAAGCPPLLTANGGVFDTVGGPQGIAGEPIAVPRGKHIFIAHDPTKEQNSDRFATGELIFKHRFVAILFWSFTDSTGNAQQAVLDFEAAVDRCFQRIQEGPEDKTHGWAMSVGEDDGFPVLRYQGNPVDNLKSGEPIQATIHYGADQTLFD